MTASAWSAPPGPDTPWLMAPKAAHPAAVTSRVPANSHRASRCRNRSGIRYIQKAGAKAGSGFTVIAIRIALAIVETARTAAGQRRRPAADSTAAAASGVAAHGTVSPVVLQRQVSA